MNTRVAIILSVVVGIIVGSYLLSERLFNVPRILPDTKTQTVTIDEGIRQQKLDTKQNCTTFARERCGNITISGKAANATALEIALVGENYDGSKKFDTILDESRILDTPGAHIKRVVVSSTSWSTTFRKTVGTYRVLIYDGVTHKLLAEDLVIITD